MMNIFRLSEDFRLAKTTIAGYLDTACRNPFLRLRVIGDVPSGSR